MQQTYMLSVCVRLMKIGSSRQLLPQAKSNFHHIPKLCPSIFWSFWLFTPFHLNLNSSNLNFWWDCKIAKNLSPQIHILPSPPHEVKIIKTDCIANNRHTLSFSQFSHVVVPGCCTNETFNHRASSRGMGAEDKTHYDPWLGLTWLSIPLPATVGVSTTVPEVGQQIYNTGSLEEIVILGATPNKFSNWNLKPNCAHFVLYFAAITYSC